MKRYEKIEGKKQELKVQVYYSKGGMNYFNGKVEPRGYWLSVLPVDIERRPDGIITESFMIVNNGGTRLFLKDVKRQSDKAYAEAVQMAESRVQELIDSVKSNMK